jgi:hypothetical protein
MKILFVETVAAKPHLETAAEIIFNYKKNKNNEIKFAWLGDNLLWNDWQLPSICGFFRFSYRKRIDNFINFLTNNKIECTNFSNNNLINNYNEIVNWANNFKGNLHDLRKYKYKKFPLGEGVASSIISYFRNENIELDKINNYVQQLLISAAIVIERVIKLIIIEKPNTIITFNGRFSICYPIALVANKMKIKILFHDRGASYDKYEIFKKNIHDHDFRAREIRRYWKLNKNEKKKSYIGKQHFLKRRNREPVDMGFSFVKNQKKNYLSFNNIKKRIVVFYTATDYEQAAAVYDYNQENVFRDFLSIINNFKDIHLIIRVHPGLNIKNNVEDKKWNKYSSKNVTVINSDDKTDTYKLMDIADIIVTYSSRIIVETVYWGKKSISLSNVMFYSRFKIGLHPYEKSYNKNTLKKMLKPDYKFKKINRKKCLYVGYYFETYGIKYKYYKPNDYFNGTFNEQQFQWKPMILVFLERIKVNLLYRFIKNRFLYNFFSSRISLW